MQKIHALLAEFKRCYDNMDYAGIANLFNDQVNFSGTAESEYKQAIPEEIQIYFAKIGETRSSQELEIIDDSITIDEDTGEISVNAIFHSVAKPKDGQIEGDTNPDKLVRFTFEVNTQGKLTDFNSEPR